MVGYAIMRGHTGRVHDQSRISDGHGTALSRACSELVEHERQEITVCCAASEHRAQYLTDPLPHQPGEPLEVQMYKVIDPGAFLAYTT